MMSDNNDLGAIASGTGALAVPVEPVPVSPLTGFDHLSQRARDIAADTVFRINSASTTHDPENTAAYCQYMREGAYDDDPVVQATLTALVHGEAAYGALSKAATRFDHCADMIAESFSASGTLRGDNTLGNLRYAFAKHRKEARDELLSAMQGVADIVYRAESNASGNPEWDYVGPRVAAFRAALVKAGSQS